jgi:hypothetical protein
MAKLRPWYQVVTPREDLRENRPMDALEFAVHLDHIREGRETVSKDYSDPARFFDRTYMTESLLKLCSQGLRLGEETAGTTKSCSSLMATGRWPFSPSAVAIVTTGCHVVSFSPY